MNGARGLAPDSERLLPLPAAVADRPNLHADVANLSPAEYLSTSLVLSSLLRCLSADVNTLRYQTRLADG